MIRWGVLGTGAIARSFAEAVRRVPGTEVAAAGSRTHESAEAFARAFSIAKAHGSYEALVGDPDVDVVYVATPASLHRDHCLLALSAGKSVLCEKPFTTTAAEAREVVAKARETGLFCMEAMWTRFLPAVTRLRKMLASGTIGAPRLLQADLGFPAPFDPTNRFFDPALGGGALLDLGVYPLSLAFFLFGRPDRIVAQAEVGDTGVDEDLAAVLHFPRGELAVVTATLRGELPGEGLIVGTRGRIRIHAPLYRPHRLSVSTHPEPVPAPPFPPSAGGALRRVKDSALARSVFHRFEGLLRPLLHGRPTSILAPFKGSGYDHEIEEVVRCLRENRPESEVMPLDETVEIMEAMDVIRSRWTPGSP